jgi:AAA+ superfamily predicted ATPase
MSESTTKTKAKDIVSKETTVKYLVDNSNRFNNLINTIKSTASMSVTGITNFVVNHENPYLVDFILKKCFVTEQLYNGTVDFDSVELQHGRPGRGSSVRYLDELIYGTFKMKEENGQPVPDIDPKTGKIRREHDGFVTRKGLYHGKCQDKILVVKNMDYTLDFCKSEDPGVIDTRALMLLDRFRDPKNRIGCCMILITNKPLDLPFKVNVVEIESVGNFEVRHILNVYMKTFKEKKFDIHVTPSQIEQVVRKLSGLTYTEACDVLGYSLIRARKKDDKQTIDMAKALRVMRKKVNADFMNGGFGLQQLVARPWEDYICPEESNFTFDVKKLLRDFREVEKLTEEQKTLVSTKKGTKATLKKEEVLVKTVEDLRTRMPHVIVLYGQGGVGKSAFPVHLAGLLDMDIWDFNINATHSKWIGQGGEQMRESLKKINQSSHVIVRIDEYDRAIGSTNERGGGMHEAHKQVESEFMNWLQNSQEENLFVKRNIFVVMTTNHVRNITGPMLRSGRADLVIDIGSFDTNSIKEAFTSCARRMKNRGVSVVGFNDDKDLQKAINGLDLDRLSELAKIKRFTVRDIEMLVIEMAAHKYYFEKYGDKKGIPWTTESFAKVLEKSVGSVKDGSTGELVLGDRRFNEEDEEDIQVEFSDVCDIDKLKEVSFDDE